jgi:WD40 repeat protein
VPRGFSRSNLVLALRDTILVCDLATGNTLGEPIQIGRSVNGIEIKHEEKLFVWTDQEVQIWDLPTRRRIGKSLKFDTPVALLDVSADAHRVLLFGNSLEVWDVPTANRRLVLPRYWERGQIGLDPSGTRLIYLSSDLTLFSSDHTLYRCDLSRLDTEHTWVDAASFADLIVSDTRTPRYPVKFSDSDRTVLETLDNESMNPVGPSAQLSAPCKLAMESPRHDLILTGCDDGSAQLWSLPRLAPVGGVMRHSGAVTSGAFCPDGRTMATGSGRTARIWDVAFGRPIGPPMDHPADIKFICFSADGRWLLVQFDAKGGYRWPVPVPMEGDADGVLDRVKQLTR